MMAACTSRNIRRSPPIRMSVASTTAPASRPRPVAMSIFGGCGIIQFRHVSLSQYFQAIPEAVSLSNAGGYHRGLGSLGPKLGPSISTRICAEGVQRRRGPLIANRLMGGIADARCVKVRRPLGDCGASRNGAVVVLL